MPSACFRLLQKLFVIAWFLTCVHNFFIHKMRFHSQDYLEFWRGSASIRFKSDEVGTMITVNASAELLTDMLACFN